MEKRQKERKQSQRMDRHQRRSQWTKWMQIFTKIPNCCMIGALEKRDKQRESVGEAECCERGVFCSFMTFENVLYALVSQEVSVSDTALTDYSLSLRMTYYLWPVVVYCAAYRFHSSCWNIKMAMMRSINLAKTNCLEKKYINIYMYMEKFLSWGKLNVFLF